MGEKTRALLAELDLLKSMEFNIINRVWDSSPEAVDLNGVALTEVKIKERVEQLAGELVGMFPNQRPVLVGLMDGATPFANLLCDALNKLGYEYNYTTMSVSSYGHGLVSGNIKTGALPKVSLVGEHVIILDDVCDTGKTLKTIIDQFSSLYPKSVKSMVLVDKVQDRPLGATADFYGFKLSKEAFIIGMGLDYLSGLRNKMSIRAANRAMLPTTDEDMMLARKEEIIKLLEMKAEQKKAKLTVPGSNSIFAEATSAATCSSDSLAVSSADLAH